MHLTGLRAGFRAVCRSPRNRGVWSNSLLRARPDRLDWGALSPSERPAEVSCYALIELHGAEVRDFSSRESSDQRREARNAQTPPQEHTPRGGNNNEVTQNKHI